MNDNARLLITLIVFILFVGVSRTDAQVPTVINYQGFLSQGDSLINGTVTITFSIYNSETSATALWQETQNIVVKDGVFHALLGSVTPFPPDLFLSSDQRFLGVKVGNNSEMTPRFRFASVAFAIQAGHAQEVADNSVTRDKVADDQVVKSLNSLTDNVTLAAGDNISIVSSSDSVLEISATAGASGITNVIAGEGLEGGGNTSEVELSLADAGVTNSKLADNAVTTAKIANNTITTSRIQPDIISSLDGVSNDGGNIDLVAGANVSINSNDANNTITISAANGGGSGDGHSLDAADGDPIDAVFVNNEGDVGIGTSNPARKLHIQGGKDAVIRIERDANSEFAAIDFFPAGSLSGSNVFWGLGLQQFSNDYLLWSNDGTQELIRLAIKNNGNVGLGTTSPGFPLEMASGAHVTSGGVWTNASSREVKKDIEDLSTDEAFSALSELRPVKFKYKVEPEDEHVGFIAEDVPELVATSDRKGLSSMDIVAVLTKIVQEQQKRIEALETEISRRK